MKFTRYKTVKAEGFTLVETLVSTFIITIVIVGPLTLASNASSYARLTKDTLIATYLAQEAIELLRYHQDSIYIRCADQDVSRCAATSNERPSETAWRIFKERFGGNAQGATCFVTALNDPGCSYDFIDMTNNPDANPFKYSGNGSSCGALSYDQSSRTYVCSGVRGSGLRQTNFSRTVKMASVPTWSGVDAAYNDDLRVSVSVRFKRPTGYSYEVKVVDFLHARP